MSDNDRLRIVVLEGSVLELLALNKELVEAAIDAKEWFELAHHPVPLRLERVIAKANRRGSSPTAPLTQQGEQGEAKW